MATTRNSLRWSHKIALYKLFSVCYDNAAGIYTAMPGMWQEEVTIMKENTHPNYYEAEVVCSCGNRFKTGSTKKEIRVEVCSACHPFYTGSKRLLVEQGGRVDKFKKKYGL